MTGDFTGIWTNQPAAAELTDAGLRVTAVEGSDAWRLTSYGFIHDTEHALLREFPPGHAVEVTFTGDFSQQFDQAGVFLRVGPEHWVKAGVEYSDGVLQVGAVVTNGSSDWSVAPVAEWGAGPITVRASWAADALTIRARSGDDPFRLVRVLPLASDLPVSAGPFVCAPTRAGLEVTFTSWDLTEPDDALH